MARIRSYVQGPRWAGFKEMLYRLAGLCQVRYATLEEDKGLLVTTIYYEVTGPTPNCQAFRSRLRATINEWNDGP